MERMNAGWRYQFIARDAANRTGRFVYVSDIGAKEADFVAKIHQIEDSCDDVNIYVSVKNRSNTIGGPDWKNAIHALENVAVHDRNRVGPYLCIFGIAMDRGLRSLKKSGHPAVPISNNTELWKSDFFWPFFTNQSYINVIKLVLKGLIEAQAPVQWTEAVPNDLIESFGRSCREHGLVNNDGVFNDPYKLAEFFCWHMR